ncbi:hypothetical protein [Kordia jejudonensis]|uniref:hypothetical protein n=1 Tax=Kordia jejudonensis TaxID=1348245 RepID=UPI0012E04108|nr:hypothetical protein [Kordia jejudonensis]
MRKTILYLTILFLLLILNSCGTLEQLVCESGVDTNVLPETALCTKDASTLEQNYITLKGFNSRDPKLGPGHDNRIISFTYEQMLGNLKYLIVKARELGIDKEELGFRVYFGAKKDESFNKGELKAIASNEVAYSTVFFVATVKGTSDDENDYENVYEIPALNYGGSRRPPDNEYKSDLICPVHGKRHLEITD